MATQAAGACSGTHELTTNQIMNNLTSAGDSAELLDTDSASVSVRRLQPAGLEYIALEDLHESPTNPRSAIPSDALQELVASMNEQGQLSPIMVRRRVAPLFASDPDAPSLGYELVFGHRRLRAARELAWQSLACTVVEMSDDEVRLAQITENLQRQDVHAIDEAQGYEALMKTWDMTADEVARQVGKSRSHVFARLKLLQAVEPVRKACQAGEIGSETALLIARLRHAKLQERALAAIKSKYYSLEDGGKKSFRQIRSLLAEMFTLRLGTAIFDAGDFTLVPDAGDCHGCPKLSGNAPEYQDLCEGGGPDPYGGFTKGAADLCTDPICWKSKRKAHLARKAADLREAGHQVVDGRKAAAALASDGKTVKGAYLSIDEVKRVLREAAKGAVKDADKAPPPRLADLPTVLIQDQRSGKTVKAVAKAALAELGVSAASESPAKRSSPGFSASDWERNTREREQRAEQRANVAVELVKALRMVDRTEEDLDLVLQLVVHRADGSFLDVLRGAFGEPAGSGGYEGELSWLRGLDAHDKGVAIVAACLFDGSGWLYGYHDEDRDAQLESIAARLGLDLNQLMAKGSEEPAAEGATDAA